MILPHVGSSRIYTIAAQHAAAGCSVNDHAEMWQNSTWRLLQLRLLLCLVGSMFQFKRTNAPMLNLTQTDIIHA